MTLGWGTPWKIDLFKKIEPKKNWGEWSSIPLGMEMM
jgi:hypothetical protein